MHEKTSITIILQVLYKKLWLQEIPNCSLFISTQSYVIETQTVTIILYWILREWDISSLGAQVKRFDIYELKFNDQGSTSHFWPRQTSEVTVGHPGLLLGKTDFLNDLFAPRTINSNFSLSIQVTAIFGKFSMTKW